MPRIILGAHFMAEPLKNSFDRSMVERLARSLVRAHPPFRVKPFVEEATREFDRLELMDRARRVATALRTALPASYPEAVKVILDSFAHDSSPPEKGAMDSFRFLPYGLFVAEHGLDDPHFEPSMKAQYEITKRFTSEFSIRAFLERHPERTLARFREWARDPDPHVRRLVSEGSRPRLPWAGRLRAFQEDPRPVLGLLELLKDDESEYVRRSVANNLNDIGKDHPDLLVEVASRWLKNASPERAAVVRHALRWLVKQSHPGALRALGHGEKAKVTVKGAPSPSRVPIGGKIRVNVEVASRSRRQQRLAVDLKVAYVKADGSRRPKVFKMGVIDLEPGKRATLTKVLSFAQHTTRRHFKGRHPMDVIVNGQPHPIAPVTVVAR
jgi:3-methyladenine DNA glycosylase AlkC